MKAEAALTTVAPPVVIVIPETYTHIPALHVTIAIIQTAMEAESTINLRKLQLPVNLTGSCHIYSYTLGFIAASAVPTGSAASGSGAARAITGTIS